MPAAAAHSFAAPQDSLLASMPVRIRQRAGDLENPQQQVPAAALSPLESSYLNWDQDSFSDSKNIQLAPLPLSAPLDGCYDQDSPVEVAAPDIDWPRGKRSYRQSIPNSFSSSASISPTTPSFPAYAPNSNSTAFGPHFDSEFGTLSEWDWTLQSEANQPSISPSETRLKTEPLSPKTAPKADMLPTPAVATPSEGILENPLPFQDEVEEPLFPTPAQTPQDIPSRVHVDSAQTFGEPVWNGQTVSQNPLPSAQSQQPQAIKALSPTEEAELRAIAMPSTALSASMSNSPESTPNGPSGRGMRQRKRKSSPLTEEEEQEEDEIPDPVRQPPVKKTAHNMIEKRYRTNLNDKINALRESVPSLRVTEKSMGGGSVTRGGDVLEDLEGLSPANKLNKATILSKASEYITHLERRNKTLLRENSQLNDRIVAFEQLMLRRNSNGNGQGLYVPDQLMLKQESTDRRVQQEQGGRRIVHPQLAR